MLGLADISLWHWVGFTAFVLFALALDLGLFHRESHEVKVREALMWTGIWVACSLLFGLVVGPRFVPGWTAEATAKFVTGYLVELSLSMDNVFVIAVIFTYFGVPRKWQHRVLFWGILGALLMRGGMIWAGTELLKRIHWMIHVFGVFLLFTGVKMLFFGGGDAPPDLAKNPVVRLVHRFFPVAERFDGEHFTTREDGRRKLTPLALVLVVVETTDVVFAVDSIPAIFGITTDPFLVFTSNVFAILGLRSLYFVLASAMGYFRYLKTGLALVLVVIGVKMILEDWLTRLFGENLKYISLGVVLGLIVLSVIASLVATAVDRRRPAASAK
jgi:tellurite resistance protein TerC